MVLVSEMCLCVCVTYAIMWAFKQIPTSLVSHLAKTCQSSSCYIQKLATPKTGSILDSTKTMKGFLIKQWCCAVYAMPASNTPGAMNFPPHIKKLRPLQ